MQELSKLHLLVLVVVGHVVVADQIRDSCGGNRLLELVGLSDKPIGKLATVAHSLDPQTLAIDPQVAPHRRAYSVENVLSFVTVLVAEHGIGKLLAVTRRTTIVHVEHGVTLRSVDLVLEVEARTICSVRSSMNHHDKRMLGRSGHADGLGEKRLDVESIVVTDKSERFNLGDGLIPEKFVVELRELAGRRSAGFVVELCSIARRRETVSDRFVLADRRCSNATGVVYDVFGLSPGDGQPNKVIAAAFLHGEIDGAAVGRPLWRALTIVNRIPDFAALAAVGVHDPDVGVFHGRFPIGEATARATIDDGLAVRRP